MAFESTPRAAGGGASASVAPVTAHVGLGSNEGDRLGQLRRALFALAVHPEISVTAVSRVYETQYVGPGTQSPFLNACAAIRTALAPAVLLAVMQGTEARLGRRPATHMQPRPLDLDLLLYGDLVTADPRLTLPHPRMRERAFVLVPLQEIAAEARLPDSGETVAAACAKIARRDGPWVRPLPDGELWPRPRVGEEREWRAALALHCR